jgi:colicin import membrane protein
MALRKFVRPEPGRVPAAVLAVLVHIIFFGFLIFGLNWKTESPEGMMVDLWSSLPPAPAPVVRAAPPAPPKPVEPAPEVKPPETKPLPKPEPPPSPKPDIAIKEKTEKPKPEKKPVENKRQLEKERKEKELQEKKEQEQREKELKEKAEAERKEKERREEEQREKERKEKEQKEKERKEKAEKERKEKERREEERREKERKEKEQKEKERKEKAEKERKEKEQQARVAAEVEQLRREQEERDRLQAEAAAQARLAKEIDEYKARILAKIRRNIVMPQDLPGNPVVEFDVTVLPGGDILDVRLRKSSGFAAFDNAVERAIALSRPLPLPPDPALFPKFRNLSVKVHYLE